MLKKILMLLALVIAAVLIYAATRRGVVSIARSVTIKAPPARIFTLIDSFPAWRSWSPYEKLDPSMQRTFSGPASGVGAKYAWNGNKNVGTGSMRVIEATSPSAVAIEMTWVTPFAAQDTAQFTIVPHADSTSTVTWAMRVSNPYLGKLMGLVVNMEAMMGDQFSDGLSNLKREAERHQP